MNTGMLRNYRVTRGCTVAVKSESRGPKAERNTKAEGQIKDNSGAECCCFGFRVSGFFRPSDFGLRPSTTPRRTEERATQARRDGFTLVEMLLVLVILATLAAIVYPKVMGRSEQARITAAQTQIANFKTALDAFEVDTGYYPKGRNGFNDLLVQPRDVTGWHGPYLESIPKDPWGNDYIYECPGKHNPSSYDISSQGSPGAQTPIGNWQMEKR